MEGVRSRATIIVPGATFPISTSSIPRRSFRRLVLTSLISEARCLIISSSIWENMPINMSQTASTADSAHCPASIILLISPDILGSEIITRCPSKISASLGPILFLISDACAIVSALNFSTAALNLSFSAAVSSIFFFSYVRSCSAITHTLPIPIPREAAIPLYMISSVSHPIRFPQVLQPF